MTSCSSSLPPFSPRPLPDPSVHSVAPSARGGPVPVNGSSGRGVHDGAQLIALGLSHDAGGHTLFTDLDVHLSPGTRLALVGPNGSGKTTLLRILAGQVPPRQGSVGCIPRHVAVLLVDQCHRAARGGQVPSGGALDVAGHLECVTGVREALDELAAAEEELASGGTDSGGIDVAVTRHAEALERWVALGGAELPTRAAEVLAEVVGVAPSTPVAALSGGQYARLQLAGVLLARGDVLLLDEPGNDLDVAGVALLRDHLAGRRGATVVATHDRTLVDPWATEVLELDGGHWTKVTGGLDELVRARRHEDELAGETRRREQDRRQRLRDEAARRRSWAARAEQRARRPADNDKYVRAAQLSGARRQAALSGRAQSQVREQATNAERPRAWQLQLELPPPVEGPDVVLSLCEVDHPRLTGPVSLELRQGDRLAVVGPNGCGKSTLLSLATGALEPESGTVVAPPGRHVVYLDQHRDQLPGSTNALDAAAAMLPDVGVSELRGLLAKFSLGAVEVGRPVGELSVGQATRLLLAVASRRPGRLLVLDEPTNHLDLAGREQLVAALSRWRGTVLVATHDQYLVDGLGASTLTLGG